MTIDIQNNPYIDIANGTVVTGIVGGCVAAPLNYVAQKVMLKHSDFWIDKFEKSMASLEKQKHIDACKKSIEYLRKGKVNRKSLFKTSLKTACWCAAFYCVYGLVRNIFIKKDKPYV